MSPREMLLTGRRMDAAEAATWGLVNRVVPASDLHATAVELATAIVASAPLSIGALLDIDRRTHHLPLIDAMGGFRDLASYRAAIDSEDAAEGVAAFEARRTPEWKGR